MTTRCSEKCITSASDVKQEVIVGMGGNQCYGYSFWHLTLSCLACHSFIKCQRMLKLALTTWSYIMSIFTSEVELLSASKVACTCFTFLTWWVNMPNYLPVTTKVYQQFPCYKWSIETHLWQGDSCKQTVIILSNLSWYWRQLQVLVFLNSRCCDFWTEVLQNVSYDIIIVDGGWMMWLNSI